MNKRISVVIPAYNEERYIEQCLKSLVNQTVHRDEFEIVVVDGGSADRTVELAEEYADVVIQQKSRGVGGARNDGVEVASAELVATTDADILLPNDWLSRICAAFELEDVVAVYGPIDPIEDRRKYRFLIGLFNKLVYVSARLNAFYATLGSNTAFRRRAFLQIGGYSDMDAGDDYEIAVRLKHAGKIYYDAKLYVQFSMRRMEKFGIARALYIWAINVVAAKRGKKPTVNYMRQQYE
jgi:glycosyltransferase involved in cell wall biosynthesis